MVKLVRVLDPVWPLGKVGSKGVTYFEIVCDMHCLTYKGLRDSDADLVGLNRLRMDSSGHHSVKVDLGSRLNSTISVDGGPRPPV